MRLLLIESSVAAGAKGAISPAGHVAAGAVGGRGKGGKEGEGAIFRPVAPALRRTSPPAKSRR